MLELLNYFVNMNFFSFFFLVIAEVGEKNLELCLNCFFVYEGECLNKGEVYFFPLFP